MKKLLLSFVMLVSVGAEIHAQKTAPKSNLLVGKPLVISKEMTAIKITPSQRKSGDHAISICGCRGDCNFHLNFPTSILKSLNLALTERSSNDLIYYTPAYQQKAIYTNKEIMKLPEVNTYDIIKILDTDRFLTQW